ncbi:hypothetical protein Tco_1523551 [Tanacetum coccineum]
MVLTILKSTREWGFFIGGGVREPYSSFATTVKENTQKKARNDPTMSSEYEQYLKADFVSHLHPKDFATFDVLGFWKAKENQFPVLYPPHGHGYIKCPSFFDASSDGSSGEPRHDYMMSSGAEDDQTGDGHDGSMSHGYY